MSSTKQSAFDAGKDEVERRISTGEPFWSIENMIDKAEMTNDQKAALWLLAWSEQRRPVRTRLVLDALSCARGQD